MEWRVMAIMVLLAAFLAGCGGGVEEEGPIPEPGFYGPPDFDEGEEEEEGEDEDEGDDPPTVRAVPAGQAAGCPAINQKMVTRGRSVFRGPGNCTMCHGSDARGTSMAPRLRDHPQWLDIDGSYGSIIEVVRNGVPSSKEYPGPMPPKGGSSISPTQVCQVAAYVYSISHQPKRR